jgi:hypothetical protein
MEPSSGAMIGASIAHLKPASVAVLARVFLRSAALPGPFQSAIADHSRSCFDWAEERGDGRSTASQCRIWSATASHYPEALDHSLRPWDARLCSENE